MPGNAKLEGPDEGQRHGHGESPVEEQAEKLRRVHGSPDEHRPKVLGVQRGLVFVLEKGFAGLGEEHLPPVRLLQEEKHAEERGNSENPETAPDRRDGGVGRGRQVEKVGQDLGNGELPRASE